MHTEAVPVREGSDYLYLQAEQGKAAVWERIRKDREVLQQDFEDGVEVHPADRVGKNFPGRDLCQDWGLKPAES